MGAFKARYTGSCAARCGTAIEAGDQVVYVDDVLVHVGCEEDARLKSALQEEKTRVVCEVCWLLKPCPCDDGQ